MEVVVAGDLVAILQAIQVGVNLLHLLPRASETRSISSSNKVSATRMSRGTATAGGKAKTGTQLQASRSLREQSSFSNRTKTGYARETTVIYKDSFSNNFCQYMTMLWIFHHWDEVDHNRFDKDKLAELEAKVKQMEKEGMVKNPDYSMEGVDHDLQFKESVIDYSEATQI